MNSENIHMGEKEEGGVMLLLLDAVAGLHWLCFSEPR